MCIRDSSSSSSNKPTTPSANRKSFVGSIFGSSLSDRVTEPLLPFESFGSNQTSVKATALFNDDEFTEFEVFLFGDESVKRYANLAHKLKHKQLELFERQRKIERSKHYAEMECDINDLANLHQVEVEAQKPKNYVVELDDTLIGIALKFHTNVYAIKKDNNMTGDNVYPGQVLIVTPGVPKAESGSEDDDDDEEASEEEDKVDDFKHLPSSTAQKLKNSKRYSMQDHLKGDKSKSKTRISLVVPKEFDLDAKSEIHKYPGYYFTLHGKVKGNWNVSSTFVSFDPDFNDIDNGQMVHGKPYTLSDFQVFLDLNDVLSADSESLPNLKDERGQSPTVIKLRVSFLGRFHC
eukprot:TRINITY_DN806_c0_g2_i4.p2 TRINITY_DN806_c0_g2~~TRINITY_DN806_c0_g2_i4.p2  ORF type:complete len:349 (+),score=47.20 TRINITY_DN806_c0_g2_i4:66-1112(+)